MKASVERFRFPNLFVLLGAFLWPTIAKFKKSPGKFRVTLAPSPCKIVA